MIWTWFHLFIKDDGLRILPGMYNHIVIAVHFQKSTVCDMLTQAFFCTPQMRLSVGNRTKWFQVVSCAERPEPYNTTSKTSEDLTPRGTVPNGILRHVNTASMANLPFLEGLIGNWKAWPHKHWKRHVHKSSSRLNLTMPHARHIGGLVCFTSSDLDPWRLTHLTLTRSKKEHRKATGIPVWSFRTS